MTASYPLKWPDGWERTVKKDRHSSTRFAVTFDKAYKDLMNQMRMLGVTTHVLSSYLPLDRQGRVLGGSARTLFEDPGVAIYFERGGKEYVLAQDAFDTPLGNLRSIGLAMEGLRQLERHGGAHLAERAFGGFAALPPPEKPFDWREELQLVGLRAPPEITLAAAKASYKTLAATAHPDKGGSAERMAHLNKAIAAAHKECGSGAS